jgi:protein CpxP
MHKNLLVVLSVLSLSAAGAALAQGQPQGPSPQQQLSQLHDALRLNPAQEPAWRAYAAALAPDPSMEARRRSAADMMPKLTTPRRIDLINAEMSEDMAAMRRQGEAVKAFYAQLSPQQQSTFDRITAQAPGQGEQP